MTRQTHTIVVGGGVIGAFCAWYLRATGREVTIVDKNQFGAGCSHGNCGYVSPSHVLPLPSPGQIGRGLKGMFSRQSALRIRPQLSFSFWQWMLKFASRCNRRDMLQAGHGRNAILESSRDLYGSIIESEELNVEWQTHGLMFVFRDQPEFEHFAETDRTLREIYNVPAKPIEGPELVELEPALKPGLAGAWLYENDAHLRPDRLMSEMRRKLEAAEVRMLEEQNVTGLVTQNNRVQAIRTNQGEISADEFVFATGPLTPLLNRELGCRIPIQPGKGYSITMTQPEVCPKYPMLLEEVHVGITPFETGYRVGSTMEFAGYNTELNQERLQYLRTGATEYLLEPLGKTVTEEWFGWRPMTWDGLPYIDRTPAFANAWVAAGHNMLGLSMGTGTGRLIAELVAGKSPHIDPQPYRIGRK